MFVALGISTQFLSICLVTFGAYNEYSESKMIARSWFSYIAVLCMNHSFTAYQQSSGKSYGFQTRLGNIATLNITFFVANY